jgi:hypothetical protein
MTPELFLCRSDQEESGTAAKEAVLAKALVLDSSAGDGKLIS